MEGTLRFISSLKHCLVGEGNSVYRIDHNVFDLAQHGH